MKRDYRIIFTIFILLFLGALLRLKFWPNSLSFGHEQANDIITATNMFVEKRITLLGPMSEIDGVFHSPVYYYLIGPISSLFGKNPAWVALFIIFSNVCCIPIIYFFGKKLFNKSVGLISAVLFTFSFEVVSYGIWIANASVGLPFILLAYFYLYKSLKEDQKYFPVSFLFLSLSTTFDLLFSINLIAFFILFLIYNKNGLKIKTIILSSVAFITPLITYPIFELRHNFLMSRSILSFVGTQDADYTGFFRYLTIYIETVAREFTNVFFPLNGFVAGVFMILLVVYLVGKIKENKTPKTPWVFLAVWSLATFPNFLFKARVILTEYSLIGINAPLIIIAGAYIYEIIKNDKLKLAIIIILTIVFANIIACNRYIPNPRKKLLDSQRGIQLKDTLAVIDYTYTSSSGNPFTIHTVTVPLYISKLWDYLYSWYGWEKYRQLPLKDQNADLIYLIIENGSGYTYDFYKQKRIDELNQTTKIEETKHFGLITVEKRSPLPNIKNK